MDCIFDAGDDMIEVLKQAFADAKRNERHKNVAETRYWLNQYKLIAEQAIAELESQEPSAWVGLTDEEVNNAIKEKNITPLFTYRMIARAIEAKLKEKNS